jgi:ATP phosphoribosyltransferase
MTEARARGVGLTLALPRGRPWQSLRPLLLRAAVPGVAEADPDARLFAEAGGGRLLFTRPADVVTYVREGVADAGVTGRDVLLEDGDGLVELLELPGRAWRLALAAPNAVSWPQLLAVRGDALRVATSYPAVTVRHFAARGLRPHVVRLRGGVELAPAVGLADCVVDMVETGRTLAAHGLREVELVERVTLRLVASPSSHRWRRAELADLQQRLQAAAAG